jgi:hypothetical protein
MLIELTRLISLDSGAAAAQRNGGFIRTPLGAALQRQLGLPA